MRAYEPAYSQDALEVLLAADSRQRSRVRALVRQMCRTPSRPGDYQAQDKDGQRWEIVLMDGVILTYRADDAVRELRIATIEWAD
jgi:hypothetical protein